MNEHESDNQDKRKRDETTEIPEPLRVIKQIYQFGDELCHMRRMFGTDAMFVSSLN
jgi:hypothetical protein